MSRALDADLHQIPPERRAFNSNRSVVLGWYVARHDEDRYDETTEYRVGLFDSATGERLTFFVFSVHERADTGTKQGEHLVCATFDPADEYTIVFGFADGSEQRAGILDQFKVLERSAADLGVVESDAEKEAWERMRQNAAQLKAKLELRLGPRR